jgi:hypothetical protein
MREAEADNGNHVLLPLSAVQADGHHRQSERCGQAVQAGCSFDALSSFFSRSV